MDTSSCVVLINGEDKTDSVASYKFIGNKCYVVYRASSQVYRYNAANVKILRVKRVIDPSSVTFKYRGRTLIGIREIRDHGKCYRVIFEGGNVVSCESEFVELSENCLADRNSEELFEYFKDTASAISLKTEGGINILSRQYDKIHSIDESTVLAKYLDPAAPIDKIKPPSPLVYPFGLNQSQKKAVENAFSSQISIIQGPPGTGKTQTILNLVANAVINGAKVAVVSNNNSATLNVAEKLEKYGVSFITAFLGSSKNKERFIDAQTGHYPDMSSWRITDKELQVLEREVAKLSEELDDMLNAKNRIANIEQELLGLSPEQFYFNEYYKMHRVNGIDEKALQKLGTRKLLCLWTEYEATTGKKIGLLKKLMILLTFSRAALDLYSCLPDEALAFLQYLYYNKKIEELKAEKANQEEKLREYCFEDKMKELTDSSMQLFKAALERRYAHRSGRQIFNKDDLRCHPKTFNEEYPVILSTTYSIKGTLSTNHIYDILIVDEASQVDLATSVLAFSCAKNIVIVGDQKQLPNVLTEEDILVSDSLWNKHKFNESYHFSKHSMLSSAIEIWKDAPSVLLREHYRCHPKIAKFFNKKFYNEELVIMTADKGEKDVLAMYKTVPGTHAKGRINQRQIDVVKHEIIPKLIEQGHTDIGIISPYRDQAYAMQRSLGNSYEISTVHKFQGREKDAIVLVSVDNDIGSFVDDPNMLNVAVSRAVRSLSVVISSSKENEKTNYGDLEKYIRYNNFEVISSKLYSVFDLLYKDLEKERKAYLSKHKKVSEFDSENLVAAVLEEILDAPEFSKLDMVTHYPLATLIKDAGILNEEEKNFATNRLTHIDIIIYNTMDKIPIMAIEVDGVSYHVQGSRQAERDELKNCILLKLGLPLLRLRTNESNIRSRITEKLRSSIG